MYAIITACIFDLQVLGDLMMCILFYDDQQERKLEYKEKIHLILLYVLYGLLCIFLNAWYVQTPPQDFFIFCVLNVLSLICVGDESGRNDLKATGGVETFAC